MQELIDKLMLILRAVYRFRWIGLLLALIMCLTGWLVVSMMPPTYQATARVYVDSNSILKPLLRDIAIQPDVNERVRLLSSTLLSRPKLQQLVDMSGLDKDVVTKEESEKLLDKLAETIFLDGDWTNPSIYHVHYTHEEPEVARRVVQAMISIFIESTLGEEMQDSKAAQKFLDAQIKEYDDRLRQAEKRLSEFKRRNAGKMPSESGGYYQRLENATERLRESELSLRETQNRQTELEQQIARENAYLTDGRGAVVTQEQKRIATLSSELDELLLRYTERHPRVALLRESILALEEKESLNALNGRQTETVSEDLLVNPVYQEMRKQLTETGAKAAGMRARVAEFKDQVQALESTIEEIPKVEAMLQQLDRDYETINAQYVTLLQRRESARISESVEQDTDEVKFRVIDPPFVPSQPQGPGKPILNAAVLLLSLGAGAALAITLALIKPVFYEPYALAKVTGAPVLGQTMMVRGAYGGLMRLLNLGLFTACTAGLFALFLFISVPQLADFRTHLQASLMQLPLAQKALDVFEPQRLRETELFQKFMQVTGEQE